VYTGTLSAILLCVIFTRSARVQLKLKEMIREWVQKQANPAAVDGSTMDLLAASGRTSNISVKIVTSQLRHRFLVHLIL
jgi:hypothetical protein